MKEQGVWERDAFEPQRPRVVLGDAHSWPQGLGAVGPGAGGGGRDSEPRLWSPWGERWAGCLSLYLPEERGTHSGFQSVGCLWGFKKIFLFFKVGC